MAAGVMAAVGIGSSLLSYGSRRKAARKRRKASREARRQSQIQNELSRRAAIRQQRAVLAQTQARSGALGIIGSSSASSAVGGLSSQLSATIVRQQQKQASNLQIGSYNQQAAKADSRADFISTLGQSFSSLASAASTESPTGNG